MSNQNGTAIAVREKSENGIQTVDLTSGNLPTLATAKEFPMDLMADYWTPEEKGESKRVYFDKFAERPVADQTTGDIIELECAYFLEEEDGGTYRSVSNGSKRLIGALQANGIKRGTPLLITYLGKKKNKTNSFQSDNWSVKILMLDL